MFCLFIFYITGVPTQDQKIVVSFYFNIFLLFFPNLSFRSIIKSLYVF